MAKQLLDVDQILQIANADFVEYQNNLLKQIKENENARDEKSSYKIEVTEDDLTPEEKARKKTYNDEIEAHQKVLITAKQFIDSCNEQISFVEKIYSFNPYLQKDVTEFVHNVHYLSLPDSKKGNYQMMLKYGKAFGIKCPISTSLFSNMEQNINKAWSLNRASCSNSSYIKNPVGVVNQIRDILGNKESVIEFFSQYEEFMEDITNRCEESLAFYNDQVEEFTDQVSHRIIDELDEPYLNLAIIHSDLRKKCDKVVELARIYNEDPKSQENINNLAAALRDLGIITPRIYKFLTHQKDEKKYIEYDDETKEVSSEETINIPTTSELESKYYSNPNSHTVICFLGESGEDIWEDISKDLDSRAKKEALEELTRLFKGYISEQNFYVDFGKAPFKNEANKVVNALLEPPYNFNYRRFGTKHDPFRIHAIHRYSKLLKDLKFGDGNIMFFGAVGPVFDDTKEPTYQKVGKRAIKALGLNKNESKLDPNFDYIEHITRGYVPYALLSNEDKLRMLEGHFSSKDGKTGKEKSIGKIKYFLFDCLDNNSKNNVVNYLNNYFSMQSNYMFSLMNENDEIKNKTV